MNNIQTLSVINTCTIDYIPSNNTDAINKGYVDTTIANYMPLTGGSMTGSLTLSSSSSSSSNPVTKEYVDTTFVKIIDNTITSPIKLSNTNDPASAIATPYFNTLISGYMNKVYNYVPISGGNMLGIISLANNPTSPSEALTKYYVDNILLSKYGVPPPNSIFGIDSNLNISFLTSPFPVYTIIGVNPISIVSGVVSLLPISDTQISSSANIAMNKLQALTPLSNVVTDSSGYIVTTTDQWANKAGDTMTGTLTITGLPSTNYSAVNLNYVNNTLSTITTIAPIVYSYYNFSINPISNADIASNANISLTKLAPLTISQNVVTDSFGYLTTTPNVWLNKGGDTMLGSLAITQPPVNSNDSVSKQYVDNVFSSVLPSLTNQGYVLAVDQHRTGLMFIDPATILSNLTCNLPLSLTSNNISISTITDINISTTAAININKLTTLTPLMNVVTDINGYLTTTNNIWINKAGDTMNGILTLASNPTTTFHAVTKQYVSTAISTNITVTSPITFTANTLDLPSISDINISTLAGITFNKLAPMAVSSNVVTDITGNLTTTPNQWINKAGDSMTGALTLAADPVNNLDAATKRYVDATIPYTFPGLGSNGQILTVDISGSRLQFANQGSLPGIGTSGQVLGVDSSGALQYLNVQSFPAYTNPGDLLVVNQLQNNLTYYTPPSTNLTCSLPLTMVSFSMGMNLLTDSNIDPSAGIQFSKLSQLTPSQNVVTDINGLLSTTANVWINNTGDTINGNLTLNSGPSTTFNAANKSYVDGIIATTITATAPVTFSSNTVGLSSVTDANVSSSAAIALNKLVSMNISSNVVTDANGNLTTTPNQWLNKGGDTMTGTLTITAIPTLSTHLVTKGYVTSILPLALPSIGSAGQILVVDNTGTRLGFTSPQSLPPMGTAGQILSVGSGLNYINPQALPSIGALDQILLVTGSTLGYTSTGLPALGTSGQLLGVTTGTLGYINPPGLPSVMGTLGQILTLNTGGTALEYTTPPITGFGTFGQILTVNSTATALQYTTPPVLPPIGQSGQILSVNSSNALTYITPLLTALGTANQVVTVNGAGTGLIYTNSSLPTLGTGNQVLMYESSNVYTNISSNSNLVYTTIPSLPTLGAAGTYLTVSSGSFVWSTLTPSTNRVYTPQFAKTTRGNVCPGLIFIYGPNVFQCGFNQGPFGTGYTNTYTPCIVPMQITSGGNITGWLDVAYSGWNALALTNDGRVFQWGEFNSSRIGLQVVFPVGATSITYITMSSGYHQNNTIELFAIDTNGKAYSWGASSLAGLGLGNTTTYNTPQLVTALTGINIVNITVGTNSTTSAIAITNNGSIYTWGYNHYGGLGQGNTTDYNVPTLVSGSTNVTKAISICGRHTQFGRLTMYLTSSGAIYGAGYNGHGTLGTGNTTNSSTFVRETTNGTFTNIFANSTYSSSCFAVDTSGNLHVTGCNNDYCFGNGTANQAIVNSFANSTTLNAAGFQGKMNPVAGGVTPKVVSGGDIYFGYTETYVLDNTGTLWAAGQNTSGQAGINLSLNSNSCIQTFKQCLVPNNQKVLDVIAIGYNNSNHGAAIIMADNTIASCGINNNGALGNECVPTGTAIPYFKHLIDFSL